MGSANLLQLTGTGTKTRRKVDFCFFFDVLVSNRQLIQNKSTKDFQFNEDKKTQLIYKINQILSQDDLIVGDRKCLR